MSWEKVEAYLEQADSIAFDGCHKIYVLGDLEQTEKMVGYEYEFVEGVTNTADALARLRTWFDESCGLRFIEGVSTDRGGLDVWETLIGQGELDECEDCGESGCEGVCNDYESDEEDN